MITLEKIISSNLDMLKSQEAELLRSLEFVQKAKKMFELRNAVTAKGPKSVKPAKKAAAPKAKKKSRVSKKAGKKRGKRKESHLTRITAVLSENKEPMASGDLIKKLFSKQSKVKDIVKFRSLIYPALTIAYKQKSLKLANGKIHLVK